MTKTEKDRDLVKLTSKDVTEDVHFGRKALFKSMGYDEEDLRRPIIAVANSWNEILAGHNHLRQVAESVKAGIWQAGGMPVEFNHVAPCDGMADGNPGMHWILPSRDIIAASIEMMVQSSRVDGIVALSTCDKIVPAQLMALARINLPAIIVTGGYMMPGRFKGKKTAHIGFVPELYTDWKEGRLPDEEYQQLNECVCPTVGACSMMGTANTFCCMTEALGMSLPGNGTTAAVESGLRRLAHQAGRQVVRLVEEDIRPRDIMTREAVANAMKVHSAIGGSTNALLHVPAVTNELGFEIPLVEWDEIAREVPHLANITTGSEYTMEDFANAGGVQAVMKEIEDQLYLDSVTCTLKPLREHLAFARNSNPEVIRSVDNPVYREGAIAILRGNISPSGAVLKQTAVRPEMTSHRGPARVFDSEDEAKEALIRPPYHRG